MSGALESPKSFWNVLVQTLASLSNGVLQAIWKLLSPVTRNGKLFILKPLDLLLPNNKIEPVDDELESDSSVGKSSAVSTTTSLFPSGEIKSLNSTESKVGYPVACSTSDASSFDVIQLRNQNGTIVGWDFSGPGINNTASATATATSYQNQYDASQNEFFDNSSLSNQNILLGLENFDFLNENHNYDHARITNPVQVKQPNQKLVMRRNNRTVDTPMVASFPYSRQYHNNNHNHNHNHNHQNVQQQFGAVFSPEYSEFDLQHNPPNQQFAHRSDSINSNGSHPSSVSDFEDPSNIISQSLPVDNHFFNNSNHYSDSAELSPPELEILQSPVGFYNTNDFNTSSTATIRGNTHDEYSIPTNIHHSSESPEIYPLNNPNTHLFPVDPINSHNVMVNGVYPLVHSRANSENGGSPEHVANFKFEKTIDDLTWPGLGGLSATFTATTSSPNSTGLVHDELTPIPIIKHDEFQTNHNNNEFISPGPIESWGYLPNSNNTNAILSPDSSVTSASSIDLIIDESSPLSIASVGSSTSEGVVVNTSPVSSTNSDSLNQFSCPECDASFRIKGYLTRHMKKHADQKAYTCPFFDPTAETTCHPSGGFSRRDTYKTHLKARHFVYPSGTRSEDRAKVSGGCGGCGIKFDSNERWVEDHIQLKECVGLKGR